MYGFRAERGAVTAEAAIVFPVVFLVLAGIIQFAMIFSATVNVRNASAAGARAAVLEGATESDVIDITRSALVEPLDADQLDVVVNTTTVDGYDYLEVQATYPLPIWFTALIPGLGTSFDVNAVTRMR